MGLIERDEHGKPRRWTIRIGTVDGYRRVKDNEPKFHEDVEIEVVAAELLEGAVGRADDLRAAIQNILDVGFNYAEEYRDSLQATLDADAKRGQ
jgi:hypothetical protein